MEKIRLQHRQLTTPEEIITQAHFHHGDVLERHARPQGNAIGFLAPRGF